MLLIISFAFEIFQSSHRLYSHTSLFIFIKLCMKYIHTETNISEENEYPKLVRDKIPEIIKENDGINVVINVVKGTDEHLNYLQKKVVEEASELRDADSKEHLVEEDGGCIRGY